jgi:hypothetical protein
MRFSRIVHHAKEHSTTILFIAGFVFDVVMLPEVAHAATRYLGYGYLSVVAFFIFAREWVISRNTASRFEYKVHSWLSFGIAYFSGAALSFVLVYAIRSADITASWPLFAILAVCILVNEVVSAHSFRLLLDIGVLFIATLFFTIFNAPFYLKVQNDATFALSVGITIAVSLLYIYVLRHVSETTEHETPKVISLAVGIPMFVGMLYFLNAIPAVPLSLKEAHIYHHVTRTETGDFLVLTETEERPFAHIRDMVMHEHTMLPTDDGVYFYASVQAPTNVTAPISHVWEYYDNETKKWITSMIIPIAVVGGREEGYRSYSKKENIEEGKWRVTVMVGSKRVVGRRVFTVIKKDEAIPLREDKI